MAASASNSAAHRRRSGRISNSLPVISGVQSDLAAVKGIIQVVPTVWPQNGRPRKNRSPFVELAFAQETFFTRLHDSMIALNQADGRAALERGGSYE